MRSLLIGAFFATPSHDLAILPFNHLNLLFYEQKKAILTLQQRWRRYLLKMAALHLTIQLMNWNLTPEGAQIKDLWEITELKPGDHVCVTQLQEIYDPQTKEMVERPGYYHHLIFIGDGYFIEFNGPDKNKVNSTIRKTSMRRFTKSLPTTETYPKGFFYVIPYKLDPVSNVSEEQARQGAVEAAKYYKEKPHEIGEYSLLSNNCERLVLLCKLGYDRFKDTQVDKMITYILDDLAKKDSKLIFTTFVAIKLAKEAFTISGS